MENEASDVEGIAVHRPVDVVSTNMRILVDDDNALATLVQKDGRGYEAGNSCSKHDYSVSLGQGIVVQMLCPFHGEDPFEDREADCKPKLETFKVNQLLSFDLT